MAQNLDGSIAQVLSLLPATGEMPYADVVKKAKELDIPSLDAALQYIVIHKLAQRRLGWENRQDVTTPPVLFLAKIGGK